MQGDKPYYIKVKILRKNKSQFSIKSKTSYKFLYMERLIALYYYLSITQGCLPRVIISLPSITLVW
jgi:hypothetical protein